MPVEKGNYYEMSFSVHLKSLQTCLTLCDHMDCSLPDFSVHGIFQARILEQVDISYPGIKLASLVLAGGFFTTAPPGKPNLIEQ